MSQRLDAPKVKQQLRAPFKNLHGQSRDEYFEEQVITLFEALRPRVKAKKQRKRREYY